METPAWLYKEYAMGSVTSPRLQETEKLAAGLSKGTAAMMVGTALASPVLAAFGAKGAEKMMDSVDRMNFDRDLKKVLEVNKDIGKASDKNVRLAYQSIRATNPKFSKDPLIAGTLLRQILQNKVNPYDPNSPARVDLNIASQLQGSAGRGTRDFVIQSAADSMAKLPGQMMQADQDLRAAAEAKAEADRRFDLNKQQFELKKTELDNRIEEFDKGFKQRESQFDAQMGQRDNQFAAQMAQRSQQFADSSAQKDRQFAASSAQKDRDFSARESQFAAQMAQRQAEQTQSQTNFQTQQQAQKAHQDLQQQNFQLRMQMDRIRGNEQMQNDALRTQMDYVRLNDAQRDMMRPGSQIRARRRAPKMASSVSLVDILHHIRSGY